MGMSPRETSTPRQMGMPPSIGMFKSLRTATKDGAATLQARTRHREVTGEGDCGDGSGCGNGRDEAGGAARAAGVVLGGDIAKRSAGVIRAGGTLVTIVGPTEARPSGGLTIDFVVVPDRAQLSELVQRVRDGRLRTNIGTVAALDDAVAAFNPTERIKGKTIIRVRGKILLSMAA